MGKGNMWPSWPRLFRVQSLSRISDTPFFQRLVPTIGGGAAAFYFFQEDSGRLHRIATYGFSEDTGATDSISLGEGLVGECARQRTSIKLTIFLPIIFGCPRALGEAPPAHAASFPLVAQDNVLGAIELASFRPFNAREESLVAELLPMATMSLEVLSHNIAREELLVRTQEQARQLEEQATAISERSRLDAMNSEIGEALVRSQDFSSMMQSCAEAVLKGVDGAFTRIWMVEPGTDTLVLCTSVGLYTHLDGSTPESESENTNSVVLPHREPLETNLLQAEPGVDMQWAHEQGLVSFAGYPLVVQDRLVGVIVTFARHPLSDVEFKALAEAASRIGLGIQRRQTEEELERINFLADGALELTKAGYWHVPLDGSGWYNSSERAVRIFGDPPRRIFATHSSTGRNTSGWATKLRRR